MGRGRFMKRDRTAVIDALLKSDEPSVRWKALVRVAGEDPESRKVRELREEIRTSPRARGLIAGRDKRFVREAHVYATWRGAHWTLAMLAEIGYPAGDESLLPMRDQVLDRWLDSSFYMEFESKERRAETSERGRRSYYPGALSSMRVAAGQRALFDHAPGVGGQAQRRPGRAIDALAMAGRRMEL
jgi:ADP-ribose pyrophosphatase YjhB (NUDIX family)